MIFYSTLDTHRFDEKLSYWTFEGVNCKCNIFTSYMIHYSKLKDKLKLKISIKAVPRGWKGGPKGPDPPLPPEIRKTLTYQEKRRKTG